MEPIKYTKRIGHVFERVRDLDNIKLAIREAAKRKTDRPSVRRILDNIDGYALKIQGMLDREDFVPCRYHIRQINDGITKKKRDIAVPRFYPDQCIHHAFVQVFKETVLHSSYEHSCGCVPGKGTRGAKDAIERWIRNDPKGTKYVLKLDVRKCYPTMPHEVLRKKLAARFKDQKFLRLAFKIIASFQQAMVNHTQMLPEEDAVGIPVGLYTSPWFCNFFFSDIDHAVARETGTAHNVRYVDDMILFDRSKRRLHKALAIIQEHLQKCGMEVKDNWQVFPLNKRPLDFLGFRFHRGWTTIRRSIMFRISRKAKKIYRLQCFQEYISPTHACGMISYMGYIYESDSWKFCEKYVQPFIRLRFLKGVVRDENRKHNQTICAA